MPTTVEDLLEQPFHGRSIPEKLKILMEGAPRPSLKEINKMKEYKKYPSGFESTHYAKYSWLAGSDSLQKLYCWPCILFCPEKLLWNFQGFRDLSLLSEHAHQHENDVCHIKSLMSMQKFRNTFVENQNSSDSHLYNEEVKKNREVIKRLTDVVWHLIYHQKPSRRSYNHIRIEDCVESLKLLKKYDCDHTDCADGAISLLAVERNIIDDISNAIFKTYLGVVKKETKLSTYVSLILSDNSVVSTRPLISTVLRYIRSGEVMERLVDINSYCDKVSKARILSHFSKVVQEFDISDRIIGLSVDGAVIQSGHLTAARKHLRIGYPYMFFVPCHFHKLNRVLQQSLYHIEECVIFFSAIDRFKSFFQRDAWRTAFERSVEGTTILEGVPKWNKRSWLMKLLLVHRIRFIGFFSDIVTNYNDHSPQDVIYATDFHDILNNFEFVFQLAAFNKIFRLTLSLHEILKSHTPERIFATSLVIADLPSALSTEQRTGFESIWAAAVSSGVEPEKLIHGKPVLDKDEVILRYKRLYEAILDCLINHIRARFEGAGKLDFLNMLDSEKFESVFLMRYYVNKVATVHNPYFDKSLLWKELRNLCTDLKFSNSSVYEIFDDVYEMDLVPTFKTVLKVASMILTLPCKPPSLGAKCSLTKNIEKWCSIETEDFRSNFNILRIEKDYIQKLKQEVYFHDNVIYKFQEINKSLKLLYM